MTATTFDLLYRDYVTDGNPASGAHSPVKADIRDTLNYRVGKQTGGFYSNHNALDGGRQDAGISRPGDRFIMGDEDDLKPGRTYYTITSITRTGTTATVTTSAPHGYSTGNTVQITGANQTAYCGTKTITVTGGAGSTTFTYTVSGSPTTPATGDLRHSIISGTNSWLELLRANTVKNSQLIALSADGFIGAIFGSRVSDNSITGEDCIGVAGWALNDGTLATDRCYAGYFEALTSGPGGALGIEIDIVNGYTTETSISSNAMGPDGSTVALWLASGGEKATKPFGINAASAAIGIINNGETFLKGIVFGYNSIDGCTGSSGSGVAIEMIAGHELSWLNVSGSRCAYVRSDARTTTNAMGLVFSDSGASFQNVGGTIDALRVVISATGQNGIAIVGGATGTPALIQSIGETNAALLLRASGTGDIAFQNGSNAAIATFNDGGAGVVNYFDFTPAATGLNPTLAAAGSDSNINLALTGKGTGVIRALTALQVYTSATNLTQIGPSDIQIENRAGNVFIDLVGDATYTDYGLRFIREYHASGNGSSRIYHKGTGQVEIDAVDGGAVALRVAFTNRIKCDATGIGFFNSATVAKPTVSGSRGGNAALASLLTELANLGLITNSTSA